MDYSFNTWLSYKYDKKLYRYDVIDNLYRITLNNLEDMGLTLNDEEYFFTQFVKFIYHHSNNKTELFIAKVDINRDFFDTNFQDQFISLISQLDDYLQMYGFYDIYNSKNKELNLIELIYQNIQFNIDDESSESEFSEEEYIID
tara:strand:+ start:382 stop:813 length:432 start_codon:yes stop_codon:yes gene_type:complete